MQFPDDFLFWYGAQKYYFVALPTQEKTELTLYFRCVQYLTFPDLSFYGAKQSVKIFEREAIMKIQSKLKGHLEEKIWSYFSEEWAQSSL